MTAFAPPSYTTTLDGFLDTPSSPLYSLRATSSEYVLLSNGGNPTTPDPPQLEQYESSSGSAPSSAAPSPRLPQRNSLGASPYPRSSISSTESREIVHRPPEYRLQSKLFELNLGPRDAALDSIEEPVFGVGSTVKGHVQVKKFEHILSVSVSLEGMAVSATYDRGLVIERRVIKLLKLTKEVYAAVKGAAAPANGTSYPFTFDFPTDTALPPSFAAAHPPGMDGQVHYYVRVDIVRAGLRTHQKIRMPILYLPRSHTPAPVCESMSLSVALDTKVKGINHCDWNTIELTSKSTKIPTITAQFSLPRKMVSSSEDNIPYIIKVFTTTNDLSRPFSAGKGKSASKYPSGEAWRQRFLELPISVDLIKTITLRNKKSSSARAAFIGTGQTWRDIECPDGCLWRTQVTLDSNAGTVPPGTENGVLRVVRGTVQGGVVHGEASWGVEDLIEVKYAIRIKIEVECESTGTVVTLRHDEPLERMTTHGWDVRFPDLPLGSTSANPSSLRYAPTSDARPALSMRPRKYAGMNVATA